jgi:hypothetical protein
LTVLDDAIHKHIAYIVSAEKRPFSYIDFLTFEVDQQHYNMSHGTFRNKISAMRNREEIEVAYHSKPAFYTIKGVGFAKTMTPHHTGGYAVINVNLFPPRITIHKKSSCIQAHTKRSI